MNPGAQQGVKALSWTLLLVLLCFVHGAISLTYKVQSDEEKLLEYLFQDYNPSARPVLNSSKTVQVNLQFSLLLLQELNVRSQILTSTGLLIMEWKDERLTWDREISSLDTIVVDGKKIWRPEFAVINGAESIYGEYTEFQAVLHPDGSVRWEPGGVFKTMCHIDITYYPFDEQTCELIFGAWSYYTTKMNLSTTSTTINKDNYEKNGEWELLSTSTKRREFHFECCPNQRFSNIGFSVALRRRHTFYIMNVILPGIMTSAVLLSIFFCTPTQKVHIGVAALLSFRLFLLNVADTIPRTSDHVPLLGIYLTCTMAITTLAMVATVFVLNLYGMKEKPVPIWAKKVFVIYLARILCMCNCVPTQDAREKDSEGGQRPRSKHKYKLVMMHEPVASSSHDESHEDRSRDRRSPLMQLPRERRHSASSPALQPLERNFSSDSKNKTNNKPDYAKEWVHVAAVCDRLFFWLCLLFILITTLILFHPITTSKYFKIPILDSDSPPSQL